jgi:hypothetical protein
MMMALMYRIKRILTGILIVLMGMLVVNNVIFMHVHALSNGKFVVHAHPYNKTQDPAPFKTHHHSGSEFLHISHLQLLFFITLFSAILVADSHGIQRLICDHFIKDQVFLCIRKGRSPPAH